MGTLNLGTGARFIGSANGLTDAPTGTIIQSDFFTTETTTTASTTSFATLYTFNFTPRQTNSELVHHVWATTYLHNGSPLPTYNRPPMILPLLGNLEEIVEQYWQCLQSEHLISLAGFQIDARTLEQEMHIINRYLPKPD